MTSIEIAAHTRTVRTGDVVALDARVQTTSENDLEGAALRWAVSHPGAGVWQDGRFVAERPGTYLVTASIGSATR